MKLAVAILLLATLLSGQTLSVHSSPDDGLGREDGDSTHSRSRDNELADEDEYFANLHRRSSEQNDVEDTDALSWKTLLDNENEEEGLEALLNTDVAEDESDHDHSELLDHERKAEELSARAAGEEGVTFLKAADPLLSMIQNRLEELEKSIHKASAQEKTD